MFVTFRFKIPSECW